MIPDESMRRTRIARLVTTRASGQIGLLSPRALVQRPWRSDALLEKGPHSPRDDLAHDAALLIMRRLEGTEVKSYNWADARFHPQRYRFQNRLWHRARDANFARLTQRGVESLGGESNHRDRD